MGQLRRKLEVEVLEDRCTPSTVASPVTPAQFSSAGFNNFSSSQLFSSQLLPNGTPASQAAILAGPNGGLTLAPLFNFAAPSTQNLAEFPTPGSELILNNNLLNGISPGMFASGLGTSALNINSSEGLESSALGNVGPGSNVSNGLGLEPNVLGNLASTGLLLSNMAGVPSTAPFPLPSYYEGLPLYDGAVPIPASIQFESLSPFVSNGMGRASYEGGDGAGMGGAAAPAAQPKPPPSAPASPPVALDGYFASL